jgi:hypothetical protein
MKPALPTNWLRPEDGAELKPSRMSAVAAMTVVPSAASVCPSNAYEPPSVKPCTLGDRWTIVLRVLYVVSEFAAGDS